MSPQIHESLVPHDLSLGEEQTADVLVVVQLGQHESVCRPRNLRGKSNVHQGNICAKDGANMVTFTTLLLVIVAKWNRKWHARPARELSTSRQNRQFN